jgi:hypothetical protein
MDVAYVDGFGRGRGGFLLSMVLPLVALMTDELSSAASGALSSAS